LSADRRKQDLNIEYQNMLKTFRYTAIIEGISYLMLFAISMPLKYLAELGQPNKYIGYAHGFLFILYLVLAVVLTMERKWGMKRFIVLFVASLLPFGTFYIDKKYLRD
jgi:integral membrane protein